MLMPPRSIFYAITTIIILFSDMTGNYFDVDNYKHFIFFKCIGIFYTDLNILLNVKSDIKIKEIPWQFNGK